MTTQQAFMIGCRLLAIHVVIAVLIVIPVFLKGNIFSGPETSHFITVGILLCFTIVLVRVLWYKSDWIVGKIFGFDQLLPEAEEESDSIEDRPAEEKVTIVNIQPILLSLLGIYVLVSTIPEVVSLLYKLLFMESDTGLFSTFDLFATSSTTIDIAALIARFAVGLWLVFGSPNIVDKLSRMRSSELKGTP